MKSLLFALLLSSASVAATAQVTVKNAWVRATVAQQKATGAFMQLQSATDVRLLSVNSPVAGVVEIHEMSMGEGGVMSMRSVPGIDVPSGKVVELKPGGFHVMLLDLKAQVKVGDAVPLTLVLQGKDGRRNTLAITVPARLTAAPAQPLDHAPGMKH
jgi:periplasmic copper chaperone A